MQTEEFTRRDFLSRTVASIGAVVGASTVSSTAAVLAGGNKNREKSSGENKSAAIDFCFSLYGMRKLKLDDALKHCAQIGYDGIEIDSTAGQSGDPFKLSKSARKNVRKQLADHGLTLPCLMDNLRLLTPAKQHGQNLDRLKTVGELGHELSPQQAPVIETVLGGRQADWDRVKNQMAEVLGDWAEAGKSAKTIIAIKAHIGGALHSPDGAKWLVDQVNSPWIKLNYDYSHFQLQDFDFVQSVKTMIDDTVFIHIKDKRGQAGKFQFLLPGDGDIDYPKYWELLKTHRYRGAVTVEVSGQIHGKLGYDPLLAANHSYDQIASSLQKAGLRIGEKIS